MSVRGLPTSVLVTGGAGFIGSHLVDTLVECGVHVIVLDNLFSGKIENIRHHIENGAIVFLRDDIRRFSNVHVMRDVEAVIHLAAVVSVPLSVENPHLTNDINVGGTLNILELSRKCDVERFIFISSCAVYGEPETIPIPESHPLRPISPYGASKAAAEQYCYAYYRVYGMKTVTLRYFNVYGPRQDGGQYSGVISIFLRRLISRKPLEIFGDGMQTRDFVYVKDVVKATLLALRNASTSAGMTFNVGSGRETPILELARLMRRMISKSENVPILHRPPRTGDIRRSCADIRRASEVLGFKPKYSLADGISEMARYLYGTRYVAARSNDK
ncbi:MAG: NAD-dependent epimerase/dehydratase family protein [Candidatus Baldrarchaeia archaeon]